MTIITGVLVVLGEVGCQMCFGEMVVFTLLLHAVQMRLRPPNLTILD